MSERIDAHHHLWRYSKDEYPWINGKMSALARDFLPADLEKETAACGVKGTVAVQARQSLEETKWLLDLAGQSNLIRGVVGWAPIASAEFPAILERLQPFGKLKGLRHVVQDEPDDEFILGAEFNAGIAALRGYSLVYDILIFERQLPATIRFVDRHPNQIFVLDHTAKPRIREHKVEPWTANVREMARRENVYCKVSGMVTEADRATWSEKDLRPYFDAVLQSFGPKRLMAGSDWPVCTLAASYQRWYSTLQELLRPLSTTEQEMISGRVASSVYKLLQSESAQEKTG
jgi:L-fuconolactonase